MDDEKQEPAEHGVTNPVAGQHPHVPGHDPLGTGQPRERDAVWGGRRDTESDDPGSDPRGSDGPESDTRGSDAPESDHEGAPLGGDESTEERLEADTAVEEDALKALDPDDTPA